MTKHKNLRRQRGFTLVELLVVIVILGGLMAIVAPRIFGSQAEADIGLTETQVERIRQAVLEWQLRGPNKNKVPDSLERLTEEDGNRPPVLEDGVPDDAWGNPLVIREHVSGRRNRFAIVSFGPDGEEGTEDDIRSDAKKNDDDN